MAPQLDRRGRSVLAEPLLVEQKPGRARGRLGLPGRLFPLLTMLVVQQLLAVDRFGCGSLQSVANIAVGTEPHTTPVLAALDIARIQY